MRIATHSRRLLAVGALASVLLSGGGTAVAAPAQPAAAASVGPYGQLRPLADLSAQRLATADLVAAAKYGTDSPIDDPARERQVLDAVAGQAKEVGADPEATVRIFRDQIEANKVVQRGLFRRWDADPSQAPEERPDLAEVRKEINRVNGELVRGIAASADARTAPYCGGVLTAAAVHVRHENRLDTLHSVALGRALPSVCAH
ncbi:chorismate mutase [Streptomyces sp. KL118A]|uniref:chorismate mutase n=1 Tax=Streptomyces sp. KL118A TaxID=3045153 RepID=UPI00278C4271|nr:chorismate mutase [Streptomyces sp. KL118A]